MTREIWIIDDERTIRDSLSQTLDIEGFHSRAFSNAKDALENLNVTFEGVIVSDINMPQMDGMTFLSKALDKVSFTLLKEDWSRSFLLTLRHVLANSMPG